jgi:hypothetical protein
LSKTYRVTGDLDVCGHKTGETFEYNFTPGQEQAHFASGTLALAEPAAAPKSRRPPARRGITPLPTPPITRRASRPEEETHT